jgi:hypothetical protein
MQWPYAERARFYQQCGGNPNAARATVYAWHQSLNLVALLDRRGLVRDGRDTATGRKVASIIREIARLVPADLDVHRDSPQTDELVAVYRRLRTLPLVEVRRICRAVVANAD